MEEAHETLDEEYLRLPSKTCRGGGCLAGRCGGVRGKRVGTWSALLASPRSLPTDRSDRSPSVAAQPLEPCGLRGTAQLKEVRELRKRMQPPPPDAMGFLGLLAYAGILRTAISCGRPSGVPLGLASPLARAVYRYRVSADTT